MTKPNQLKALLEKMGASNVEIGAWYVVFDYEDTQVELNATKAKGGAEIEIFVQPEVVTESTSS